MKIFCGDVERVNERLSLLITFDANLDKINALDMLFTARVISYLEATLRVNEDIRFVK